MLWNADGVAEDKKLAIEYLEKAAEQGHEAAIDFLSD
jgi:TPR repeat protein